jgi:hypothetical protein
MFTLNHSDGFSVPAPIATVAPVSSMPTMTVVVTALPTKIPAAAQGLTVRTPLRLPAPLLLRIGQDRNDGDCTRKWDHPNQNYLRNLLRAS